MFKEWWQRTSKVWKRKQMSLKIYGTPNNMNGKSSLSWHLIVKASKMKNNVKNSKEKEVCSADSTDENLKTRIEERWLLQSPERYHQLWAILYPVTLNLKKRVKKDFILQIKNKFIIKSTPFWIGGKNKFRNLNQEDID